MKLKQFNNSLVLLVIRVNSPKTAYRIQTSNVEIVR